MRWLALFLGLAVCLAGGWGLSKSQRVQLFGDLITRIEMSEPRIALTFDDGPSPRFLSGVLDVLDGRDVRATFFLTGQEAEQHPDLVAEIANRGHQLGNHGYSHSRMILRSPAWIEGEIDRTDAALRARGFEGAIPFRPPYGQRLIVLPWLLAREGRPVVLWDVEADDLAEGQTPEAYAQEIIARVEPGSIILMHVMYGSRDTARAALPLIIDGLHARGYSFATLAELEG